MFKIKTRVKIVSNCARGCTKFHDSSCGIGARSS